MFGLIFHWGLYSVPAFDCVLSAKRRRTQNGSEWYLRRLTEKGNFRPISGWRETQEHHRVHYPGQDCETSYFAAFQQPFEEASASCPFDKWMALAKQIGASYVVLTTRHHDGYCLWPTATAAPHSTRDLVGAFVEAARKAGLRAGLYYSWSEFDKSCTLPYMREVVVPQVRELQRYQPDLWWFDGHWAVKSKGGLEIVRELCASLRKDKPDVELNDRLGGKEYEDPTHLGLATYRVYEDRALPDTVPTVPWEHVNTVGLSWGRNHSQQPADYKSVEQLQALRAKVEAMKGRFLLNLGPDANGELDECEVARLRAAFA